MHHHFTPHKRHAHPTVMTFFLFLTTLISPQPPLHADTQVLQQLFDTAESESNLQQLVELIDQLKTNPIDLNTATTDDLQQLPWLTAYDAHAITAYRTKTGKITTPQELQPIIGTKKTTAITPYILISPANSPQPTSSLSLYTRLFTETPPRKGILTGTYAGDNYKLSHHLQYTAPHIQASLVQDKDIGEPDLADFTSLSIQASDLGIIKNAVIGNYRLNFGQGLLIGQSRYFAKGADPIKSVQLWSKQLSTYTSSSETGFLQGAATTLNLSPFEITTFYSLNHLDAIINKTTGQITSFDTSGNHRTQLEISRKDNLQQTLTGANLLYHYKTDNITSKLGATLLYYNNSQPLVLSTLSTQNSALYSLETESSLGPITIFAEAAFSENPNDASWTAAAEYEIVHGVSTIASLRRYGTSYYSPFAGAFAERGSGASNEQGDYVGIKAALSDRISLGAYYDVFLFPLLDDHCPYPSKGNDIRLFMTWKQSPLITWNLEMQHKYKEVQSNQGTSSTPLWTALPQISTRSRLDCDINLSRRTHLRTRGEVKKLIDKYLTGDTPGTGWLFYQQAGCNTGKFSIKGRFTLFNTDDYDAALYAYEDDLPLTSTLALCNGHGKSLFLLASWQLLQQLTLAARYEITWYSDRTVYSSGNDERATSSPGTFHLGCALTF